MAPAGWQSADEVLFVKVASRLTTDRVKEDNGEGHYSGVTGAGSTMICLLSASIEMMTGRSGGSPGELKVEIASTT